MFELHNGHELAQLEEVTSIVKQNICDLKTLMESTKRVNEDNFAFVEHRRGEIARAREQQM